jgi:YVTN family beta-propeller protein
LAVAAVVAVLAVVFRPLADTGDSARAPHPAAAPASRARPAPYPAATWQVAGPVPDLSVPLAGMPPVADPANIYADAGPDMLSAAVRGVPYRIYVPNSGGSTVTVIDPATYRVTGSYQTGPNPQHVVPAYDLRTLYATNDLGNSLTPISPRTGRPAGPNIPVDDPYNMYFTPTGATPSWWRRPASTWTSATRTPSRSSTGSGSTARAWTTSTSRPAGPT